MSPDIRRLYLLHLFNSIAVAVVGNYLFLDKLFLRMNLNMSQFGVIKGLSWWLPLTVNVLVAPLLTGRRIDGPVVAVGHALRVVTPFALLGLPLLTQDTALLTVGFAAVLLIAQTFPVVANNSLAVLIRCNIPRQELGVHTGWITALWFMPFALTTIPMGWYVQRHSHATDAEFLSALLVAFSVTAIFQIPSSILAWRLTPPPATEDSEPYSWRGLFAPLRDAKYRSLLSVITAVTAVSSMIGSFIYPYLIAARGWQLQEIGTMVAGVSIIGAVMLPWWGKLTDRIGGRNMVRLAVLGIAIGSFCLSQDAELAVLVFALLAWQCETGVFGSALVLGRQYMILSMSSERHVNLYLAWAGPAMGMGLLFESVVGGLLLDWLRVRVNPDLPGEHYRIYFTYCAMGFLLCGGLIAAVRDGKRVVTAADGLQHGYRWMRSVLWRGRL